MKAGPLALVVVFATGLVLALLAAPQRYAVEGISMGPGLLPGDILTTARFPAASGLRQPSRFDRWIIRLPDGSTGVKRIVGLPGETIAITGGDLTVDHERVLKGPRELAAIGSLVEQEGRVLEAFDATKFIAATTVVRDDAMFAPHEASRLLLPVCDAGLAGMVNVLTPPAAPGQLMRARAGPLAVCWRLRSAGRYAVVFGRLDGQAVAVAWRVPSDGFGLPIGRSCLPPGAPAEWQVTRPWPEASGEAQAAELELTVGGESTVGSGREATAVIERVVRWRDVLYRPAADGETCWQLDQAAVFVLGDFPSGSRDSRHFGPLPRAALRQPVCGWRQGRLLIDAESMPPEPADRWGSQGPRTPVETTETGVAAKPPHSLVSRHDTAL